MQHILNQALTDQVQEKCDAPQPNEGMRVGCVKKLYVGSLSNEDQNL